MGRLIGIDTSIWVYLFEDHPLFADFCDRILEDVRRGRVSAVFSDIGMVELLTGPKKQQRLDLALTYKEKLETFPNLFLVGTNPAIVEIASSLRATYGLKTPDAIHLATAMDARAEVFITNDARLMAVKEIRVQILSPNTSPPR